MGRGEHAQMIVYEAIICAALLAMAVFFVYQLHPPTMQSASYSSQLKMLGDDALRALDSFPSNEYPGYSLLEEYIIDNNTKKLTEFLNFTLPRSVYYNILVSNGTACVKIYDSESEVGKFGMVSRSHHLIFIDPKKAQPIPGYNGCIYDVIIEMWQI